MRSDDLFLVLTGGVLLLAVSVDVRAQESPYSRSDVEQGQQLLNAFCSRCHGKDGRGAKGPDLTAGRFRRASTDAELVRVIADGIPGRGMPGFGDGFDDWILPIVAYLRAEAAQRASERQPLSGNVARGYELFKRHKCDSCHWTGAEGGRLGTDLSRLTATPDHVRKSLTDPDSQIDRSYQLIQVVMADGTILRARRLYENAYFVLLMDDKENLHTIPKNEIEELHRPHTSLMPGFAKELDATGVEDLTAYLFSLQKEPPR